MTGATPAAANPLPWYTGNDTDIYDSLVLANGPAANMAYCGSVPDCELVNGVLICSD